MALRVKLPPHSSEQNLSPNWHVICKCTCIVKIEKQFSGKNKGSKLAMRGFHAVSGDSNSKDGRAIEVIMVIFASATIISFAIALLSKSL